MRLFYIFILCLLIFVGFFINFIHNFSSLSSNTQHTADAIIVLTGGHDRLSTGLKLLEEKKGQRMLLSGVNKYVSYKALMKALGIKDQNIEKRIDIGKYALNTAGNAIETSVWVAKYNYRNLYIVTNDYHMPRTLLELSMALPKANLWPVPIHDYENSEQLWRHLTLGKTKLLLEEFFKYIRSNIKFYCHLTIKSEQGLT